MTLKSTETGQVVKAFQQGSLVIVAVESFDPGTFLLSTLEISHEFS